MEARYLSQVNVSVIVVSLTDTSYNIPAGYELIVSKVKGIPRARNMGARMAKGDILVFLDSDLVLDPDLFELCLWLPENSFRMMRVKDNKYPCSRLIVISKADFNKVGGFNESLIDAPEDVDFYFRALDKGLDYYETSELFAQHVSHPRESKARQRRKLIGNLKVGLMHIVRHPDFFFYELNREVRQLL